MNPEFKDNPVFIILAVKPPDSAMAEQLLHAYKSRGIEYLNITCKSNRRRNRKERRPDKGFSRRHQTNSPPAGKIKDNAEGEF